MEKETEKLWASKCKRDSNKQHFWQFKGLRIMSDGEIFEIFKCSQCALFLSKKGEWIK